jgi:hypothetical protein
MEPAKEWLGLGWDAWGAIATLSTGFMAIVAAFAAIWATGRSDRRKAADQVYGVAMRVVAALQVLRAELKDIEKEVDLKLKERAEEKEKPDELRKRGRTYQGNTMVFLPIEYNLTDGWIDGLSRDISLLGLGCTQIFIFVTGLMRDFQHGALDVDEVLPKLSDLYRPIDDLIRLSKAKLPPHLRG